MGNRSMSPMPLDDPKALHSSTSVGPGLGGLQPNSRQRAPSPRAPLNDPTISSRDARMRAESPLPLGDSKGIHSTTSVGPGLNGLRSKSPAPPDDDDFTRGPLEKKKKKKDKKDKSE